MKTMAIFSYLTCPPASVCVEHQTGPKNLSSVLPASASPSAGITGICQSLLCNGRRQLLWLVIPKGLSPSQW